MADKDQGGDKTELPTQKRLRDARKKGDIAKSKDFSSAIGMAIWFALALAATGFVGSRIAGFMEMTIARATTGQFDAALSGLGWSAAWLVVLVAAIVTVPAAIGGLAAEFMQTGALLTTEKMKPSLDKMNPVEGLKRMFALDNLFELVKTLIKAALIVTIVVVVLANTIDEFASLVNAASWSASADMGPEVAAAVLGLSHSLTLQLLGWTVAVFLAVALADRMWTRHRYIKKLKMSRRDIKQEHKDNEGDPMLKSQRRQMHEEWANQNAVASAGQANVLLTNPTHIAIALDYDPESCPIPVVAAKGEGSLAAAMRAEAERAGVPIVRNVPLARGIFAETGVNEIVPEEQFEAIAEIILWAKRARAGETPREREDAA